MYTVHCIVSLVTDLQHYNSDSSSTIVTLVALVALVGTVINAGEHCVLIECVVTLELINVNCSHHVRRGGGTNSSQSTDMR